MTPGKSEIDHASLSIGVDAESTLRIFCIVRQCADAIHRRDTAIGIFPDQLISVEITVHHHGTPSEDVKVQNTVVPDHAG